MMWIVFWSCWIASSFLSNSGVYTKETRIDRKSSGSDSTSISKPPYIPTTGTFRALIVFVQFKDDTFDAPPSCISDPNSGWPSRWHAVPNWASESNLIHSQAKPPYNPGSMSDYYHVMSHGVFNFVGEVFPELYLTPESKSYYDLKQGRGRGWLNQQIIDWMDNHAAHPVNFADYDHDNDGDVDMIIFIYRNWDRELFNRAVFQGVANLGFPGYIVRDGKTIRGGFPGSGISQHNVYTQEDFIQLVSHEIGHYQFGGDHFLYLGKFGVLDINDGSMAMSGYERHLLGWIKPTLITANTSITLTDALTTSIYYRINVPDSDEYFLLENRQALSIYERGNNCNHEDLPATGLMIAHVRPSARLMQDRVRWQAADNTFPQADKGQASDSYKPGNKTQFAWTRPAARRSNGSHTEIGVNNIKLKGNEITAKVVLSFE